MTADVSAQRDSKMRAVFVVEDDVFLTKVYRTKFEQEGVEVITAGDGNEAISYLSQHEPASVVLLDLMLPGVSGFDVLAAIRKDERWKNVPVIVLSNLGQPEDKKRAEALGIAEYIVKADVKITDVLERVKRYLNP